MDPSSDSASFREQSLSALKGLTRATNQLTAQDLAFHRSLDPTVGPAVDEQGNKILDIASNLLRCVSSSSSSSSSSSKKNVPHLTDEDSVEDNWRTIVDVIDGLLEKADACLDEFTGLIKKTPQLASSAASRDQQQRAAAGGGDARTAKFPSAYSRTSKIPKPQTEFERAPDNSNTSEPWKPLLKSKPHASISLSDSIQVRDGSYINPYEVEIKQARYPSATYSVAEPISYTPFESTTAVFVDTLEGVEKMLAQLKQAKEIAIDLEHHDTHSYQGIVSLMQISTRDCDWIVDTLKPWREELQILNEVFADPKILKIFHGAFMDMIWLQRDLGIYVVNLFDTFHAANALGYPKKSLKYLLEKFVKFQAEKQYQMADWRLRPLLPGMFDYARSDTHYLLYIYDMMRNELLGNSDAENNLIDYVCEKSKEESLQRFERPTYDPETGKGSVGWFDLLLKTSVLFSKEQFAVFRAVHRWRDEIARAEDEGLQYVLAKHALFRIAHSMPLDAVSLLRAAAPVSPVVRAHVLELVELIKRAKIEGLNGPELRDVLHPIGAAGAGAGAAETASMAAGTTTTAATRTASTMSEVSSRIGVPVVDRTEVSQFWGSQFHGPELSLINFHSIDSAIEAFFLTLPMPAKPMDPAAAAAAGVAAGSEGADDDAAVAAAAAAAASGGGGLVTGVETRAPAATTAATNQVETPEEPAKKRSNEIFTVRSFSSSSKKRKHEESPEDESLESPSTAAVEQSQQQTQEQQQQQQKQEQAGQEATTEQLGDQDLSTEGAPIPVVEPSSTTRTSKNQRKRRRQAEKRLARQQLELQEKEQQQQQADTEMTVTLQSALPSRPAAETSSAAPASAPGAGSGTGSGASAAGPTAFDYTKAESVLHAAAAPPSNEANVTGQGQGKNKKNKNKNKNKNKSFNPYAKATNTGTGLGRIKRDTSGKSHTFK